MQSMLFVKKYLFAKFVSRFFCAGAAIVFVFLSVTLGSSQSLPPDFADLSLEDLMELEVTIASKKPQKISEIPAAVFVITQEDIRRSGMNSVPELLRMVPGVNVERIDGNKWSVTMRGFSGRYVGKLLVMIDGRSIYTPLYGGVYWEMQDVMLEDVERIEVVRGPGGTLWGANAVNGVINIITLNAGQSQGTLLTAGIGNTQGIGSGRFGGRIGEDSYYRIYVKGVDRDHFDFADGSTAHDQQRAHQAGFRFDWNDVAGRGRDTVTVQGDLHDGEAEQSTFTTSLSPPYNQVLADDIITRNSNILAKWQHSFSDASEITTQIYYDRLEHNEAALGLTQDSYDIDVQHRFDWGRRQEIIWGLGYQYIQDDLDNSFVVSFSPSRKISSLFSAFVQDEIALLPDRLFLTIGTKLEDHRQADFELLPNLRLRWTPTEGHLLWGAVSRAVRVPSRAQHDMQINYAVIPFPFPTILAIQGNERVESEKLQAYELGYRGTIADTFSLDVTAFYHDYHDLFSQEPSAPYPGPPPYSVVPQVYSNLLDGEAYGVEFSSQWQVNDAWRIKAGYSWLKIDLHPHGTGTDVERALRVEESESEHQFRFVSQLKLSPQLEWDTMVYCFSSRNRSQADEYIPGYTRLDVRLGWHPRSDLELSISVQNLLDGSHPEIRNAQGVNGTLPSEVARSIFGKVTWRF